MSAPSSAPQYLCFRSKSIIRSFVGIGVAPGTESAFRKISNFRNAKSSLIDRGKTLALSIGSGYSALTATLPTRKARNAPESRHLMGSDQTPKLQTCQPGVFGAEGRRMKRVSRCSAKPGPPSTRGSHPFKPNHHSSQGPNRSTQMRRSASEPTTSFNSVCG